MLVHLPQFIGGDHGNNRIFLPIHRTLLESGQRLAPVDRHGISTYRPERFNKDGGTRYPEFKAFHVLGFMDRTFRIRDLSVAVFSPCEADHPFLFTSLPDPFPRFPALDRVERLVVWKKE